MSKTYSIGGNSNIPIIGEQVQKFGLFFSKEWIKDCKTFTDLLEYLLIGFLPAQNGRILCRPAILVLWRPDIIAQFAKQDAMWAFNCEDLATPEELGLVITPEQVENIEETPVQSAIITDITG